jgi:hypothetical protein
MAWLGARAVLFAVAGASCSLVTNLDGLMPGDGGSDAMPDVVAPDVIASDVAQNETGVDAGCPGHPTAIVCDDFDQGTLLQGWSSTNVTDGAVVALSDAQAWTTPNALLAMVPAVPLSQEYAFEASSSLVLDVPSALTKVRSTFDVYFDAFGTHAAAIGGVYLVNGFRSYGLTVVAHSNMIAVTEDGNGDLPDGGSSDVEHPFAAIPAQTWTRLILDIDFAGSDAGGPSYTLTVESPPGTPATPFAPVPIGVTLTGASSQIVAGINWTYPLSQNVWRVYVDDVIVETL